MGQKQEVREMSAGIRSQGIATTRVALPPAALAGLMGVALLIGGLLGVVAKSELDATTGTGVAARAVSTLPSRLLMERAQIGVGRGPLVQDPGASGSRRQDPTHATDHIGLSERLLPVTTAHHLEHGPLR